MGRYARYTSVRPLGTGEKVAILAGVAIATLVAMVLVNLLLFGQQSTNVANNIILTGGE